jgi:hypothetical protein
MADKYKIEKGVPIPRLAKSNAKISSTLWGMSVGDSILVTDMDGTSLSPILTRAQKAKNMKFTRRKEGNSYRVWRVE